VFTNHQQIANSFPPKLRTVSALFFCPYFLYIFPVSFPIDEQMNMKSVIEYFQETYGFAIKYGHLPCLQVGSQKKANYLPMEVHSIETFPFQQAYSYDSH